MPAAQLRAASRLARGPSLPGTTGSPSDTAWVRAAVLSPIRSRTCGEGPINTMPAAAQVRAKSAFSDRKP